MINWNNRFDFYREKAIISEHRQFRLVEFSKGFVSPGFCGDGHSRIALEGTFKIDLNGHSEAYKKGEIFYFPVGDATKHKVYQEHGDTKVLFFEDV